MTNQRSAGRQLLDALEGLPRYLVEWTIGFLIVLLTDVNITTLAVMAALIGISVGSILWGATAFFVAYSVARVLNIIANAIGVGTGQLAQATFAIAQVQEQAQHPLLTVEGDPAAN